ncbi:hypothetical protein F511_18042 [Dorcoceras hygrometricum]|uniref:Uncharacterized protein n=1 Tax=Dorcoceras hygrometricum TaxID=472368 RepID=A0A2Z7D1N8_9LAMI|nr:hypothetical protein F511_18042 [Dorcoceras hygrometricum]
MLSEDPRLALSTLVEKMRQHQLEWTRPSFSSLFGTDIQCGGILSRFHLNINFWVRQLILIDGSWTVIVGTDRWIREYSATTSSERTQLPQEPAVDTIVSICIFIEPVQDLDSRPPFSRLVRRKWGEICVDVVQFNLFDHPLPVGTHNLCTDLVAIGPVVDIEADPTGFFGVFGRRPDANRNFSCSTSSRSMDPNSCSPSSSSDYPMHFIADDIPLDEETNVDISQIDLPLTEPTEAIPHISLPPAVALPTDFTESFAHIRATVDKIHLKQVQTLEDVDDLKAVISSRISHLETTLQNDSTHHGCVFRNLIHNVQQEVKTQAAALDAFRKETQEGIATLSAQLSEIIAYINRGHDDKRGKIAAVEVCSLLEIKADQVVVVVGVNLRGKEMVDRIEEDEQVLEDFDIGLEEAEQIFVFQFFVQISCT